MFGSAPASRSISIIALFPVVQASESGVTPSRVCLDVCLDGLDRRSAWTVCLDLTLDIRLWQLSTGP